MVSESYLYYFSKLFGLFLCSILGLVAGKTKNIQKDTISNLIFFFISPVVFFTSTINIVLNYNTVFAILIIFFICSIIMTISWFVSRFFVEKNQLNLLMFSSATSNSGYFLMVIALDPYIISSINKYLICVTTIIIFEYTIGRYVCLKNHLSFRSITRDLIKTPLIVAFLCGLSFNILQIPLPTIFDEFVFSIRNSFAFLGMLFIGLNLSKIKELPYNMIIDHKYFLILMISSKIILQPLVIGTFIYIISYFHLLPDIDYIQSLYILMFAPISSSTITYGHYLKIPNAMVSLAILISTILSIFILPFIVSQYLII